MAIDQIIGSGALARGWSSYLASLCNYGGPDGFIVKTSHYDLDFVAFGFMILVTLIVIAGTQQTSWVNTSMPYAPPPAPPSSSIVSFRAQADTAKLVFQLYPSYAINLGTYNLRSLQCLADSTDGDLMAAVFEP